MRIVAGAVVGIALLAGAAPAQEPAVPELSAASFERWLEFVRPAAKEQRWARIAWRPELWPALQEAVAAQKPLLIWAMNGHPMACT